VTHPRMFLTEHPVYHLRSLTRLKFKTENWLHF